MAKKLDSAASATTVVDGKVSLAAALSKSAEFVNYNIWLVGDTPLITHSWSFKARNEMLGKQVKATRGGKEARNPEEDFQNSLYSMGDDGTYGFPAMGVKNCILSAAHKDKGVARSAVLGALWVDADMVRVRPALSGAVCDMPLLRIFGSDPEMREDMVKVGSGLQKVANLAYRGQFSTWAINVRGRFNTTIITPEALASLIQDAGISSGLGEWRNERRGVFGAFHLGDHAEEKAWDAFARGEGPLPGARPMLMAAE